MVYFIFLVFQVFTWIHNTFRGHHGGRGMLILPVKDGGEIPERMRQGTCVVLITLSGKWHLITPTTMFARLHPTNPAHTEGEAITRKWGSLWPLFEAANYNLPFGSQWFMSLTCKICLPFLRPLRFSSLLNMSSKCQLLSYKTGAVVSVGLHVWYLRQFLKCGFHSQTVEFWI